MPNQRLPSSSLYDDKISAFSSGGGTASFLSSNSFCIDGKSTSHSEPSASFATRASREPGIRYKGNFGKPSRSSKIPVTRPFSARARRPSVVISQTFPFASCAAVMNLTCGEPSGFTSCATDTNFSFDEPSASEKLSHCPLTKHSENLFSELSRQRIFMFDERAARVGAGKVDPASNGENFSSEKRTV